MSKKLFLVLFLVLFSYSVAGATIHGSVYNFNLEKMNDVIVSINTEPKQTFVVKNGSYSFNVPTGDYAIKAVHRDGWVLEATEDISVKGEGSYVLDLIMFPSLEEEEDILEDVEIDLDESYFKKPSYWPKFFIMFVLLIVIALLLYFYWPKKKKAEEEKGELTKLVDFIKEQGGRTTQKDIRKEFPSSEAKISLMITELEKKGRIERIKKGRGNVIILK